METLSQFGFGVAIFGCLGLALVSAIVPWINAEAIAIALPAIARSPAQLAGLVVVVTAGQMAGKCVIYFAGRRGLALSESKGARIGSPGMAGPLARWQARAAASPTGAIALVAVSSLLGIPPFYVMS